MPYRYRFLKLEVNVALAALVLWLVLSQGYDRMQKAMTVMMVVIFLCFLFIALRSFSGIGAIVGAAIAPGALLAIPYLSSDSGSSASSLKQDLRKSVLNLGVIFGAYAMFILIAGGFALFPLENHANIETVHAAGQVLTFAFPLSVAFLGPPIFTFGLFIAAMTTLVISVQVVIYLSLDIMGKNWTYSNDNSLFRRLLIGVTLLSAVLAPVWTFPAMLKVVLLMGVNVLVIPMVLVAMIYLLNRKAVMGEHKAGFWRNLLLVLCLVVAVVLGADKLPDYLAMF